MSDPYERAKGARLAFKGGALATRKSIEKKHKKKKKKKDKVDDPDGSQPLADAASDGGTGGGGEIYSIDAAKRKDYEQLFPVEAKKFGFDPKTNFKSIEDALDDRVKKKADRYCLSTMKMPLRASP